MPNVSVYLVAALVAVAMLAGSYLKGRSDGGKIVATEYQARDLKAEADYSAKIKALEESSRKQEQSWQAQFVSAARTYEGKVKENAKALDIALSGSRLYDRFAAPSASCGNSGSQVASNPVAASQTGTELSPELSQFLKREASRADAVVLSLNLCIGTLEAERQ